MSDDAPVMLRVTRLSKAYQGIVAVSEVSFDVLAGEILGVIGPNGSGKSTTIDCISGFQDGDAGSVLLDGVELRGRPGAAVARAGLTRTFQAVRVYERLSLLDNLRVAMHTAGSAGWMGMLWRSPAARRDESAATARADELLARVGLAALRDAPCGTLSYGQRKLAALAMALMPRPRLLVLDEPVAGVNPSRVREVETLVRSLREEGQTFLIVEHNMDFIAALCDRVLVLDQGRVLTSGTPREVCSDARVLDAYLGGGA